VHATDAYEAESELAWALRDPNASELAAEMRQHASENGAPAAAAFADRLTGRLAAADGDHATALLRFADAIDTFDRLDAPWERALTVVEVGRSQAAMGDIEAARASWVDARATFERLGAMLDLTTVDALLAG